MYETKKLYKTKKRNTLEDCNTNTLRERASCPNMWGNPQSGSLLCNLVIGIDVGGNCGTGKQEVEC